MPPKRQAEAESKQTEPSKRAKRSSTLSKDTVQIATTPASAKRPPIALKEDSSSTEQTSSPRKKANGSKSRRATKSTTETSTETTIKTVIGASDVLKNAKANGTTTSKRTTKLKVTIIENEDTDEEKSAEPKVTPKVAAKRKSKAEKEADAMPLKPRTTGLRMFVGAHVSGAGGVQSSVTNAIHIGGNAFAVFLKAQRQWQSWPLKDEHRDAFKNLCSHHAYTADKHVLPHGSYLVNLAQAEKEKADQSYNSFLDDIKRCEALGIKLYNFHPGNTGPSPRNEAISRISQQLNKAINATSTVIPVLETMAGQGNAIGSTFEDLRDIISGVEDKSRIGVCIDTCHIFAAGYDIRTPEAFQETIIQFDKVVGLKHLRGFHMNDSKAPFGSHRDLHQNIGAGFLGLRAFHNIMNDSRFEDIPMVLETPTNRKDENGKTMEDKSIWANEIKLLESLIGMDPESEQFVNLEKELAAKGAAERAKLQEQVDKKTEKDSKKASNTRRKRKKKADDSSELSDLTN